MVLEYLPTNWDYLENYFRGQLVGKYSSTMDPLGLVGALEYDLFFIVVPYILGIWWF